ncbi:MAG: hypothetical protein V2B20_15825 [Pseudomonadota bacterium]
MKSEVRIRGVENYLVESNHISLKTKRKYAAKQTPESYCSVGSLCLALAWLLWFISTPLPNGQSDVPEDSNNRKSN